MSDYNYYPEKVDYVPRDVLAKQGIRGVGGIIGSIAIQVLAALPSIVGLIGGAVVGVLGIGALVSKDPTDRKVGLVVTAAGALTMLAKMPFIPFIRPLAGSLLGIGALGLLAMGIWNGLKFIRGLIKNRR
ncbi:MAG: hypothetical protein LBM77_07730 [Spirochaetaceae bacterium]|jgi:hypothetical protein|nr:hypothetical protein [Spirochaetaceae bacterium]